MTLEFQSSKPEKIGLTAETVYTFKNSDERDLSIYDLKNIQNELHHHQAKKKNCKNCKVEIVIKCLAHQWLTFTNEQKLNSYFDNMVKDTSKFESFSQIQYYVTVQKEKPKINK
jgi:hypothetical protein